jgi:hypothetical protein
MKPRSALRQRRFLTISHCRTSTIVACETHRTSLPKEHVPIEVLARSRVAPLPPSTREN